MILRDLYSYCQEVSEKYPSMANQIMGFYDLAQMEVEGGKMDITIGDLQGQFSRRDFDVAMFDSISTPIVTGKLDLANHQS